MSSERKIQELTLFRGLHTSTRAACSFILFERILHLFRIGFNAIMYRAWVLVLRGALHTVFVSPKATRTRSGRRSNDIFLLVKLNIRKLRRCASFVKSFGIGAASNSVDILNHFSCKISVDEEFYSAATLLLVMLFFLPN